MIRVMVGGELLVQVLTSGFATGGELLVEDGLPAGCRLAGANVTPDGCSVALWFAEQGDDLDACRWQVTVEGSAGERLIAPRISRTSPRG